MLKRTVVITAIIAISGFLYWQNLNSPADANGREEIFIVNKGETISQIANNLRQENLIKSPFYFKYVIWRGKLKIKAGEYLISSKLNVREIIKLLTAGEAISQEKLIRIIEGWSNKNIGAYLEKNQITAAKSFIVLAGASLIGWKFNFAKPEFLNDAPPQANLEGYLFPDTYRIFKDTAAEGIIGKMLANFNKKLTPEIREEIRRQKKTIYEIITMASIIEKEVRLPEDMKIVSGIFWNRIKYDMPLQSDAGLSYILDDKISRHTFEQTKIASPYNTYKYRGLPPGPIANPGFNAIMAAIYPETTNYNYFLSDPATSKTIYSKTLEEHNLNKYKYLK